MVDLPLAVQFIERWGGPVERARLDYLLHDRPPPAQVLLELQSAQREDGGWPPFWVAKHPSRVAKHPLRVAKHPSRVAKHPLRAAEISSVDATCFWLAQAEQMGLEAGVQPFLVRGLAFLRARQDPAGFWEEDPSAANLAPRWAQPGDLAARLYLTANCGFWMTRADAFLPQATLAGDFLSGYIDETGMLPSFMQTRWLCAALVYRLGWSEQVELISARLLEEIGGLSPSELAWLLNAYRGVQTKAAALLVEQAVARLADFQREDGSWPSDDGPDLDANTTLEALFVLNRYNKLNLS